MTFVIFVYCGKIYQARNINESLLNNQKQASNFPLDPFFHEMDLHCGTNDDDCLRIYKLNKL